MSGDLVLLTGATGFIGYKLLVTTLKAGYRVRCAVRSKSGIDKILAAPTIQSLKPSADQLSWAIVPEMSAPGAYDDAVKGVQYIIHCASPVLTLSSENKGMDEEVYVKPAVAGVVGMLQSAAVHASMTVKRVVVTSSIVAIVPPECFIGVGLDRPVSTGESRVATPVPPYGAGFGPDFGAYSASKIAALNESEAWMKENRPAFDLISIAPSWVWGHDELSTTPESLLPGSNGVLLGFLKGRKSETPINTAWISVDDVADAHVRALSPSVSGVKGYLLAQNIDMEEARAYAKKHYPEAFANGIFTEDGVQKTVTIPTDASEGEKMLGRKLVSCEDMVKVVAGQYVQLVGRS